MLLRYGEALRRRLKEAYGVEAKVVAPELLGDFSQHYDADRRTFMISALLRPENRTFGLAYQLALLELAPLLQHMSDVARPPDAGTRALLHMSFANYAAGAIIVHETEPASYPWEVVENSWTGEQFELAAADKNMGNVPVQAWISNERARATSFPRPPRARGPCPPVDRT